MYDARVISFVAIEATKDFASIGIDAVECFICSYIVDVIQSITLIHDMRVCIVDIKKEFLCIYLKTRIRKYVKMDLYT